MELEGEKLYQQDNPVNLSNTWTHKQTNKLQITQL